MHNKNSILNALTIDVEDYFQVSNFDNIVKKDGWDNYESRVVPNTKKILGILKETNTRATFFILGWVAEKFPELVKDISKGGHEIASHGYSHRLVYNQTRSEFKEDINRSLKILEGISGKKIDGYRAASCSIREDSLWAFDILEELGIIYDSSIFPIRHHRYGIPKAERFIHKCNGDRLLEVPFSTIRIFGQNIPVAGGGYFRLYPYWVTKWAIKRINDMGHPAIVYIHPWEIDYEQPKIKAGNLANFRHYVNLEKNEQKITKLLKDFKFSSIKEILINTNII